MGPEVTIITNIESSNCVQLIIDLQSALSKPRAEVRDIIEKCLRNGDLVRAVRLDGVLENVTSEKPGEQKTRFIFNRDTGSPLMVAGK